MVPRCRPRCAEILESALGADLSRVRLHTGSASSELNRSISAVAFTHGRDIHFRDGMPDPTTGPGLHLLAHELTHTIQQDASPVARHADAGPAVTRFAEATIRRAPIPTFSTLDPRAPDTAIPKFAKRPRWLRGGHGEAETVRTEVAATVRSMVRPATVEFDPPETVYQCQLCGRWSQLEALSVDHVVDWKEFCAPAADYQEFEERYHELSNLHLVHNNCNSSKQATNLFDWWRGQTGADRIPADAAKRIVGALTRLYEVHGIGWVDEISVEERTRVISGIVRQSSRNAFEHLMGNAQILDGVGGWGEAGPAPQEKEDETMEDSD